MAFDELMGLTNRLLASALALSALAARLKLDDLGETGDPALREQLDRVLDELGVREQLDALEPDERSVLLAFARSYLAQGLDLVDDPARQGAWSHTDPVLLQAQGSASGVVATLLTELGLVEDGARILDVGTGVAGIAVAFCRALPTATVVGIDPWGPSLALARANVAEAGVEDRVALLDATVQDFQDTDGFDLVWFPSFFIPEPLLGPAVENLHGLLRPGGHIVVGVTFADETDRLAAVTDDLMTVRSGGSVLGPGGAIELLRGAGFEGVREIERTWNPPLRFVVGTRA
jgi:SAM-dependent methyltransferase